jgi:starvation-inducible DNA-binding protein
MNELVQQMKVCLASTFSFYLKTHNFHWNVEGPNFNDYHAFFGGLYAELWGAVDTIAEHIRTLDSYAPGSLGRYSELSVVQDQVNIPSTRSMFTELLADNDKMIAELTKAYQLADSNNEMGLANFLQDRIDIHKKHGWMLKATSK